MSTRRVLRRGPVKLNDDDEVVSASPVHQHTPEPLNDTHEHISPSSTPPPPPPPTHSSQPGWGTWLSSLASRTATGFDRLYELANQPVTLRDKNEPSHHEQEDKKAAADTLDDIIKRAQRPKKNDTTKEYKEKEDNEEREGEALEPESSVNNIWKPLDMASDTLSTYVQAGLKKLGNPNDEEDSNNNNITTTTVQNTSKSATLQKHLKAIGQSTVSLASKARDHWQQQLSSVDDSVDMSVDDAFQLYQGGRCLEAVRAKGLAANKLVRSKQRSLTPKQHSSLAFKEVEDAFDSERLLESVVFIDKSDFPGLFKMLEQISKDKDRLLLIQQNIQSITIQGDIVKDRHRLAHLTSLSCQLLSLIDDFGDYEVILMIASKMISELQLFASKLDCKLLEDAQYCTHLVLDCVHHLLAPVKLVILSDKKKKDQKEDLDMNDLKCAIEDVAEQSKEESEE